MASDANYEFQFDSGRNGYEDTRGGTLTRLAVNQTFARTETINNVPFGNARVRVMGDSINTLTESNETDNTNVYDLTVTPPDPGMSISVDRMQVREGEAAVLSWATTATFPLNCRVLGPNRDIANPSLPVGSQTTAAIRAKSVFTFSCTEPTTGTVFTKTTVVETTGKIEER